MLNNICFILVFGLLRIDFRVVMLDRNLCLWHDLTILIITILICTYPSIRSMYSRINCRFALSGALFCVVCIATQSLAYSQTWDDPRESAQFELMRTRDPATGKIPQSMRHRELQFASHLPSRERESANLAKSGTATTQSQTWIRRGPFDVGGRTRALAVAVHDTNVILAGGVSGGMWRSTNGGSSWALATPPDSMPGISCIAQDTRTGHTNTWYCGTG